MRIASSQAAKALMIVGLLFTPDARGEEPAVSPKGSSPDRVSVAVRVDNMRRGHAHPGICVTKGGTILVVQCAEAETPGQVFLYRSTDGGKTWSKPEPVPGVEGQPYPGALSTLSDGRILLTWNAWTRLKDAPGRGPQVTYYVLSSDDGQTWTRPKSFPKNSDKESTVRHGILELGPDEWVVPYLYERPILYHPATGQATPFAAVGGGPILRTPKGTLIATGGLRSTDQGKTWQQIRPFPPMNYRNDMIALTNGWLVATLTGKNKVPFQLVVSRDDGRTWDFEHALELNDTERVGPNAPHLAELDKATLGIVFWNANPQQSGGPAICFIRTPLASLQAGDKK